MTRTVLFQSIPDVEKYQSGLVIFIIPFSVHVFATTAMSLCQDSVGIDNTSMSFMEHIHTETPNLCDVIVLLEFLSEARYT